MRVPVPASGHAAVLNCVLRTAVDAGRAVLADRFDPLRPSILHRNRMNWTHPLTEAAGNAGIRRIELCGLAASFV